VFFTILLQIIAPIFLLIGIGALMERKFRLDLSTLAKLNFYAFVPALVFVKLLEANLTPAALWRVGLFGLVHVTVLFGLAWGIFAHRTFRAHQTILALGTVLSNVGNYGIPFILLAFGDAQIGVITVLVVLQNLLSFTFGIWMLERATRPAHLVLRGLLEVPVIYAVLLALGLQLGGHTLPAPLLLPLRYLADGLIPVALLTLGAQLARTRVAQELTALATIGTLRLLISPLLAMALVPFFGFPAPVPAVLIVASAFPVGVNVFILASEYHQGEEVASQAIFLTTLLSAVTMAAWLLVVGTR
jgi:predicted permease